MWSRSSNSPGFRHGAGQSSSGQFHDEFRDVRPRPRIELITQTVVMGTFARDLFRESNTCTLNLQFN
jgi:hypothetical protein